VTNIIRTPYLLVTIDGTPVADSVLSARTQLGYNLAVAQGEVSLTELPAGCGPFSTVVISMGAAVGTTAVRFTGYVTQIEHELYPKTVKMTCRGNLQKAETYTAMTDVDMTSYAYYLINGGTFGHHDETMVATVLYIVGLLDDPISGETVPAEIGGTGLVMGTTAEQGNSAFTWDTGTSGLSYIQKLDAICLGYRTFELADGSIVRQQISALPAVSASATFTEHVDIYRATALDTILEAKNRIKVNGYQKNKTNKVEDEVTVTADDTNFWLQILSGGTVQWYVQQAISSGLIEKKLTADAGDGLSCQQVAAWQLAELNVRRLRVNLTTHRDTNIAPGATIAVAAPTRLGITTQNFWVQEVSCEVNRQNQFTQNFVAIGVVPEPS
jgi:hypothetical protein